MGTPLPPNEPGDDCINCWGPNKPFGDGPTPLTITVTLEDLEPGTFWIPSQEQLLLTPHLLQQIPVSCSWSINDGTFVFLLQYLPTRTILDVFNLNPFSPAFVARPPTPCLQELDNDNTAPSGIYAFSGFAAITWNLEGLT